jgi:hypothetical protein
LRSSVAFAVPGDRLSPKSSAAIIHVVSSKRIVRRLISRTLNPINSVSSARSVERRIRSVFSMAQYSEMRFCKSVSSESLLKNTVASRGPKRPEHGMLNISRSGPEFRARFKALRLPVCRQCRRYFGSPKEESRTYFDGYYGVRSAGTGQYCTVLHSIRVALTIASSRSYDY